MGTSPDVLVTILLLLFALAPGTAYACLDSETGSHVPKSDMQVRCMLAARENIFQDHTRGGFEKFGASALRDRLQPRSARLGTRAASAEAPLGRLR
jgi:hypothetical protein